MIRSKFALVFSLMLLLLALALSPAAAHEGREVGDYLLTFGWRNEPALAGQLNGPELFIEHHDTEEPVEGAELQVEITFGPATKTVELRGAWSEPGHYIADLIPTRPGDYSFRVFGTIGDVEVDETFTSTDGEFSAVEPSSDIQFPEAEPTVAELLARIEALEAQIAEMQAS
ncbi:MAG: hypothetical protein H7175_12775 [Burkholderiales bacterium]|nr:hypothetical protein [Anaerolineae bacterium]